MKELNFLSAQLRQRIVAAPSLKWIDSPDAEIGFADAGVGVCGIDRFFGFLRRYGRISPPLASLGDRQGGLPTQRHGTQEVVGQGVQ